MSNRWFGRALVAAFLAFGLPGCKSDGGGSGPGEQDEGSPIAGDTSSGHDDASDAEDTFPGHDDSAPADDDSPPADGGEVDAGPTLQPVDREHTEAAPIVRVDLLLVIDNSGSMGAKQARLARDLSALLSLLDAHQASYRIGITTTDNGNPWCPAGTTTPERGRMVLSACGTRLSDFLFNDAVDARDIACNDICALKGVALEVLPTTTQIDAQPNVRPWLQKGPEGQNLPASTSLVDAAKCFVPQGINGCGFESPLEAMYLALTRAATPDEPAHGFVRDDANLVVLFFTDEVDCSHNEDWKAIFAPDGNRVFWSDATAAFPTSAVCWNAGVRCTGDPSGYVDCTAADLDVNGNAASEESAAVLHPLSRYLGLLQSLESRKKQVDPALEVRVGLFAGFSPDGSVFYADVGATDPQFQGSFGIGPGCATVSEVAVPPVRLRQIQNAFPGATGSICAADLTPPLTALGNRILGAPQYFCFPECVVDVNPQTGALDPGCIVTEIHSTQQETTLPECSRDLDGSYLIDSTTGTHGVPAGHEACFVLRTDAGAVTTDPSDDAAEHCLRQDRNLEIVIVRNLGAPAQPGSRVRATCKVLDPPPVPCVVR